MSEREHLVERVKDLMWERNEAPSAVSQAAEQIIALVGADVARRLLSEEAVEAACLKFWGEPREGETGRLDLLESKAALKSALRHIGIAGEESEK